MQSPAMPQLESVRNDETAPVVAMDPNHFPSRLHEMLATIDDDDRGNAMSSCAKIVSWQPHGKCFLIRNKDDFIAKILPRWFCRLKFTTFERQLHKHGFRKLSRKGPDQGAYYHPQFARDTPELAKSIRHTNIKGKRGRKPKAKETEPDFYSTSQAVSVTSRDEILSRSSPLHSQESRITTGPSTSTRRSVTGLSRFEEAKLGESKVGESKIGEYHPRDTLLSSALYRNPATRLTQSLVQRDLRWQPAESMQSLGMQQARSLLSPVGQHADAMSSFGGDQASFQSQLAGHIFHHQPNQGSSSFHLESTIPAPSLARHPSDFSIGAGSIFGALGDSPPDDMAATFTAGEQNQALSSAAGLQFQPGLPSLLAFDDHQERLNDLLLRNQQQQINLQRQQQQLDQQRLELQLREQQNLDLSGQQYFQQELPHAMPSASLHYREQQQQLQREQYQNEVQQQMLASNLQQQQQQERLLSGQWQPPQQQPHQQDYFQNTRMPQNRRTRDNSN